mmetsp:Transcript_96600/g.207236  ORF Transcript_96600/g.207236 Transcript_96600/m.207236 type:complete len:171 (-) Transcript_96600:180-692(-)
MEVKVSGSKLTGDQKEALLKGFTYAASEADGAKQRKREGKPLILPKSDIPQLIRACGRAPLPEEMKQLLKKVPDEGVEANAFCKLFERASEKSLLTEGQLTQALEALDLSGTSALDPKTMKGMLTAVGDKMAPDDVDKVLDGLPLDALGRIPCRLIARKLVRGPVGIQHI